ncbi:unnamed protein product, partial [Allacma fusca]
AQVFLKYFHRDVLTDAGLNPLRRMEILLAADIIFEHLKVYSLKLGYFRSGRQPVERQFELAQQVYTSGTYRRRETEEIRQRQQSSPEEQTKSTDRDYHPLLNDCVLRTCFKYLSVKTVANCRLVSKFWNQAACSYLRQKSVVKFKFAEEIYGFTNVMESSGDSPYQRFILHIFEHEIEHPLVKLLFERFGASITSITFDLQGNSRYAFKAPDPKVLKSLLELPRIEEIRLYGLPDHILRESQLFDTNSFPLLKTFSFSIYQDKYGINRTNSEDELPLVLKSNRALIFNIIESARNLQFLEIGSIHSDCASMLFQQGYFPRMTTFKTLSLNVSSFRTEFLIHMGGSCPNLTHLSCFLDLTTTPDEVYMLLSKVPLLKYLKLRGGKVVADIPLMSALKEVHFLMVCTLPLKTLMEKLPEVRIATVLLKSTDYLVLQKGGQDGSIIFSNTLRALQISLQEGLYLTDFLGRIKLNFPCLSSLRLRATSEIMKEIFRNLSTLEELYIDEGSTVSDQDITGISSEDLYSDTEDQDDINVNRTGFYIGDLKRKSL